MSESPRPDAGPEALRRSGSPTHPRARTARTIAAILVIGALATALAWWSGLISPPGPAPSMPVQSMTLEQAVGSQKIIGLSEREVILLWGQPTSRGTDPATLVYALGPSQSPFNVDLRYAVVYILDGGVTGAVINEQ